MENRMMNILKNTKTQRLTPNPILSRICVVSLILMIIGTVNVWGATCYLYEHLDEESVTTKSGNQAIFTTPDLGNVDGIDTIRFEYKMSSTWAKKVKVRYSTDGTNFTDIANSDKGSVDSWRGLTGNGDDIYVLVPESLRTTIKKVQFAVYEGSVGNYTYSVRRIQISRCPTLKINDATSTSHIFSKTAVDGSSSQTFNIKKWNISATPSVTKSGTNADQFSYSLSSASGSCPTQYTLTVSYEPTEETEGESRHTATITVSAEGKSVTLTVSGTAVTTATPEYIWSGEDTYHVGDNLDLSDLWTCTNGSTGDITYTITSFTPEEDVPTTGATAPEIDEKDGKTLSLGQAGTLVLGLSQEEVTGYEEGSDTKTITISRRTPTFTWNTPAAYYYNTTVSDFLVKTAGGDYDVTSSSEQVADMDGDDLVIYNKPGSTKIKYVHDETYKWIAKKDSVSFTPSKKSNAVPFTYSKSMFNDITITTAKESAYGMSWHDGNDCICLGNGSADVFNLASSEKEDKYVDIQLKGIPDSVTFEIATNQNLATDEYYYVKEYVNGSWSGELWHSNQDGETFHRYAAALSPHATAIRVCYSGNFSGYYKNLTVTKREYFKTREIGDSTKVVSSLDFATNIQNVACTPKTFTFHHSSAGYITSVSSNNAHFTVSPTSVTTGGEVCDSAVISVTYLTGDVGTHNGTITISDNIGNSTTVSVTGTTVEKFTPTITWTGATTTFEVGDDITNGFTVENENGEQITGDLEWTFESDDTDVVELLSSNTAMRAHTLDEDIKTTTIRGVLAEGGNYYGGKSGDVTITVKRKDNTITISGVEETMLVDATMTGISVTSTNSSGPSYTVTSMPGSDTIVYNLGAGTIVSKHITGPFSWTIHQAADGTYKAADAELNVEVVLAPEDESEKIYMYDSGSNDDDAGWKVSEFAAVDLVPVGVATTVWFDAKRTSSGKKKLWCEHYVNSEWSMFDSKAGDAVTKDSYNTSLYKTGVGLTATKVRFNSEDNDVVYVRNVKIQCRGHILTDVAGDELAITKQDDGESLIYLGDEGYKTFTVYYGLAKNSGDVTLVCDNSHFKFGVEDEKEAGLTLVDNDAEHTQCGNQEVKVYYNPTDVGTETAHVTIYNSSYSKTITITGTCKYPQTISWNIGSRLKVDAENKISNAANATVGTITYSSNNTDVVEVTDGGTKLLAKATGSATITASATGNDIYYPATSTIDVTVVESLAKEAVEVDEIADWTGDVDIWTPVIVLADADIRITTEKVAYSLTIRSGASVTVASTGGLTIGEGGISGASASSLILEAGDGNDGSVKGQTGYLRVSPRFTGDMPTAKVELYSIAYADNSNQTATWQYMGIPLGANVGGWDICTYGEQFIYGWSESDGEWFDAYAETIRPFHGYCLTQNNNDGGRTFEFKGQLYAPSTKEISLSYAGDGDNKGYHVLANSYAAPIDITKFDVADFVNADATIYMFNTGSPDDVSENSEFAVDTYTTAGQYIAVTPRTASSIYSEDKTKTYPVLIPAMQGFCVKATAASASITLDYSKLVWNANYGTHPNKPLRAAAQKTEEQEASEPNVTDFIKVTLADGEAADILYLLASESYDKSYENGYDAPKMMSDDPALPNIFAVEDDGQFAIDATSDIEGTFIGVRTGAASNYTIYFSHVNAETEWMLLDIQENKKTRIANEASYSFSAKANSLLTNRFVIVEWDGNAGTATGTEETTIQNKIQKFIYNDQLFILKDGVLYDARGMVVRR